MRPEGWQRKEMHFNVSRTALWAADISASRATINRGAFSIFFPLLGLSACIIPEDVGGLEEGVTEIVYDLPRSLYFFFFLHETEVVIVWWWDDKRRRKKNAVTGLYLLLWISVWGPKCSTLLTFVKESKKMFLWGLIWSLQTGQPTWNSR